MLNGISIMLEFFFLFQSNFHGTKPVNFVIYRILDEIVEAMLNLIVQLVDIFRSFLI